MSHQPVVRSSGTSHQATCPTCAWKGFVRSQQYAAMADASKHAKGAAKAA